MASCHRAMVERTKGRRPKNRPCDTKGRRPKNRPAKGGTLEATWVRGEGTPEPWRRGATVFLQVVAATACATVTSSKPTPLGMGCLWPSSGTGLLGSGTGLFLLVFIVCVFAGTGTRFPGVRLLALPVLRKHPWPLRRSRGDGNGRPLLPSFVRHSMCGRADLTALDR